MIAVTDVVVTSFGFGHGPVPEAHIVVDLRQHFRDPHVRPGLREMTVRDRPVRRAVMRTPGIRPVLKATLAQVKAFRRGPSAGVVTIAFGCVGGRHRSAVAAHVLARRLRRRGLSVELRHRDIRRPVISR
ncbi:RapZ C-terminal domain-containing protein [Streptomyces sp. URMC 124]|uniref:RapZ C-terminal domain-containing protein n=1 Tax=Streptomyces sp. URMC 124 TaxID=3423405 RepID=UPI003F1CD230